VAMQGQLFAYFTTILDKVGDPISSSFIGGSLHGADWRDPLHRSLLMPSLKPCGLYAVCRL